MISHDVELLGDVVNKVWFLDAVRGEADVYNMGWKKYLDARATDEQRRRRERANAEKKAGALRAAGRQARREGHQSRCGTPDGASAPNELIADLDDVRVSRQGRPHPVPRARGLQQDSADGEEPDQAVRFARDLHRRELRRSTRAVAWWCSGSTAPVRRPCCDCSPVSRRRPRAASSRGHGLKVGYFAQEHDTLDDKASVWENIRHASPDAGEQELRRLLGAFMFTGPQLDQPAGTLSGGEKTRLALAGLVSSAANVLLLDEPTNNLDPVSREQVLDALRSYAGAVVLVTHDPGAAEALNPERVILLPDGTEDHWSAGVPGADQARLIPQGPEAVAQRHHAGPRRQAKIRHRIEPVCRA